MAVYLLLPGTAALGHFNSALKKRSDVGRQGGLERSVSVFTAPLGLRNAAPDNNQYTL
jgi:hypothetical protein